MVAKVSECGSCRIYSLGRWVNAWALCGDTYTHERANKQTKNCDVKNNKPNTIKTTRPYVANLNTSTYVICVKRDCNPQVSEYGIYRTFVLVNNMRTF